MLTTILAVVVTLVCGIALFMFWISFKTRNYWSSKGFPEMSSKDTGSTVTAVLRKVNAIDFDKKFYTILKSRNQTFAGYLEFSNPALFVKDLDLLRNIFVKDFDHFADRRDLKVNKLDKKYMGNMLVFMESEAWKDLRSKMSPTFTTGKIRRMFEIIDHCGQRLDTFLKAQVAVSQTVNLAEGFGKYTVDVISTAAFGIESGAFQLQQKKSIFEKMAEKLQHKMELKDVVKFMTIFMLPKLAVLLKLAFFDREACEFFSQIISNTIKHRQSTGEKRDDFLQLMLEARAGQLKTELAEELDNFEKDAIVNFVQDKPKVPSVLMTEDVICAQSILFFLAGFDTTQNMLQFAAYQLAISPEIQAKLAVEVNQSFRQNGDRFTYESINEMELMDKFVSETLRMYPPVPRLDRRCTKDYQIPGTSLVIPAGTLVVIPTYSIHHDEEIYPDPYRFDPERFSKEAKASRSPYAYMPFGHGPRNCIGMRFALTETKLAIAHLVQSFVLEPSRTTPIPIKFAVSSTLKPDGGVMNLSLKLRVHE